ncbi:MAG: transaldolase, partial [Acidimicrobiaceae bacterium]|nr:transaldolase [Acidimicrobiaceae bacterium]
ETAVTIRPMLAPVRTKIYADGADLEWLLQVLGETRISGFTTNPTLMRKAGVTDYEGFARSVLEQVHTHPISFEVFADDEDDIERQARQIAEWGDNVYVKIPVTNTKGQPLTELVRRLSGGGVKVNVTAMFTLAQVEAVTDAVRDGAPSNLSVFAGRVADAGVDPLPLMREAVEIMKAAPLAECIWASPREVLNLVQADSVGCHIITMTHDLLKKLDGLGKDLAQFSLETVQMFFRDAEAAGFKL